MLKQNMFSRISCSNDFARFQINVSSGVHLQKSSKNQDFNFTKSRIHFVVPLVILKIFRTALSWTPAANYFHYYVMLRSFLLVTRASNLYLFHWRHCKMTSNCLLNNISLGSSTTLNFSGKHKVNLLELGLYNLYLTLYLPWVKFLIC